MFTISINQISSKSFLKPMALVDFKTETTPYAMYEGPQKVKTKTSIEVTLKKKLLKNKAKKPLIQAIVECGFS